jgi:hypothetical protein
MADPSGGVIPVAASDDPVDLPGKAHPLDPVLALARQSLKLHRERDHDYVATLVKQQRLAGKLGAENRMELKLRSRQPIPMGDGLRPIDVYLKFQKPTSQSGREVIWRQGMKDDLMTVHESGLLNLVRVELAPTSRLAMMGNRYPIYDIGIERLLTKLIDKGVRDRRLGDCQVTITDDFEFALRRCKRIEVVHPEPSANVDGQPVQYEYYRAVIDMDLETGLPIHYASYLWPEQPGGEPLLDEEFTYENLRLNCQLSDDDFDPDNPAYHYPSR